MSRVPDAPDNNAIEADTQPISIVRRMARERERCIGMTDEERAWRKKWLDAQILDKDEPVFTQDHYKELFNPLRRFYKYPMNVVEDKLLRPVMHWTRNGGWKMTVSRPMMYPDNKNMDLVKTKGNQFYVHGFDKSPI